MRGLLRNVCGLFDTSVLMHVVCAKMREWGADDLFSAALATLCRGFLFLSAAEQPPNQTLMQCVRMLSDVLL